MENDNTQNFSVSDFAPTPASGGAPSSATGTLSLSDFAPSTPAPAAPTPATPPIAPTTNAKGEIDVAPEDVANVANTAQSTAPKGISFLDKLMGINGPLAPLDPIGMIRTDAAKAKEQLGTVVKQLDQTPAYLNPFAATVAEAPSIEQNQPGKTSLTEQYNIQHPLHRADNILGSSIVSGYTGGIIKPQMTQPRNTFENVLNDGGSAVGAVSAMKALSVPFQGLETPAALKSFLQQYPNVAKVAIPILDNFIKNTPGFVAYGQLNPNLKTFTDRIKAAAESIALSGVQSVMSPLPKIASMPANFGLFYGLAKLDGASDQDAAAQGTIGLLFDSLHPTGADSATNENDILQKTSLDTLNKYSDTKVDEKSSDADLKKAYTEAIKATHPDLGGTEEDAAKVNAAYSFLKGATGKASVSVGEKEPSTSPEVQQAIAELDLPKEEFPQASAQQGAVDIKPEDIQSIASTFEKNAAVDKALEPINEKLTQKEEVAPIAGAENVPAVPVRTKNAEIPKELKPLAKDAKKYRTAEGFKNELYRFDSLADGAKYVRAGNFDNFPRLSDSDETVTAYRGAHTSSSKITPGDWITLDESSAKNYSPNVLKIEIPKNDIVDPGVQSGEYIYSPKNLQTSPEEFYNKATGKTEEKKVSKESNESPEKLPVSEEEKQKPLEEKNAEAEKAEKPKKFTAADVHGGFINPEGIVKGIKTKFKEVSDLINETQKNSKISTDLAGDLDKLRKGRTADELALIEFLNKNENSQQLNQNEKENIVNYNEDKTQKLTPREEEVQKNVVQPLHDASTLMRSQMKEWGFPVKMIEEGYTEHYPIDKKTPISKLLKGAEKGNPSSTGGKNLLSKAVNNKSRVFRSVTDEEGNRTVVAVKDNRVTAFKNGQTTDLGVLKKPKVASFTEYFDELVMQKLEDLAKSLGVKHERIVSAKGMKQETMGKSFTGKNLVKTKAATPEQVLLHELGHQIDEKYDLQEKFVNDPELKKEMRALVDLKYEGKQPDDYFKRYVRKAPEKIAALFEAYLAIPQRFQEVAPKTYEKFTSFLADHSKLAPILDIKPSFVIGSRKVGEQTEPGKFVAKDGKTYTLGEATIKEIEANTNQRYYKEPVVTAALSYTENLMAYNAAKWFQAWKESPEFENIALKESETDPEEIPKTWKTTSLQQFRGYFFEPRVAEVLDDFNQSITGNKNVALKALNEFNGLILKLTLLNPIAHGLNTGANTIAERGLNLLKPSFMRGMIQAYRDITTFNENYRTMLREGAPLMRARQSSQALAETILEQFTKPMVEDKNFAETVRGQMGDGASKALKMVANIPKTLHGAAFFVGDLLMSASIYQEAEEKGISYEDAIKNVTKYQADYRLPSRIGDQLFTRFLGEEKGGAVAHGLAQLLKSNTVFAFTGYHLSGIIKPWLTAAKDTVDPNASTEERSKGISVIIIGALLFLAIQAIQKEWQKITKNPNLYVKAPGMIGAITDVVSLLEGHESAGQFIGNFLTPAPGTKMVAESIFNRDTYTGSPIFGIGGEGFFPFLATGLSSINAIGKATGSPENFRDYTLSLFGVHNPASTINTPIQRSIMTLAQQYFVGQYSSTKETPAQTLLASIRSDWQKGDTNAVRKSLVTAEQSGDLKTIGNDGLNFKTATDAQLQKYFQNHESAFKADIPVDVRDFSLLPADPQKILIDQMTYPELLKYGWYVTSKKAMTGTAAEDEFAAAANAGKIQPPTWVRGQISTADQQADAKEGKKPSFPNDTVTSSGGIIKTIATYAKAIGSDPTQAFDDIFHGQAITKVDNGTIFVQRMPESASQADKLKLLQEAQKKGEGEGKTISDYTLDHASSLELGGNNEIGNLQLLDINQAAQDDKVENYLGKAVEAGTITGKQAQQYELEYKKGADIPYTLNPEIFNKVDKTITLQELQSLVGGSVPSSGGDQSSNQS